MVLEELLAPAGSYEVLVIAVNAGADAVYIAGQNYGARAYAKNFTMEEMNNFDQDMFRFYIPEAYFDKIQTRKGFTLKKSGVTKNDSGNSTI